MSERFWKLVEGLIDGIGQFSTRDFPVREERPVPRAMGRGDRHRLPQEIEILLASVLLPPAAVATLGSAKERIEELEEELRQVHEDAAGEDI